MTFQELEVGDLFQFLPRPEGRGEALSPWLEGSTFVKTSKTRYAAPRSTWATSLTRPENPVRRVTE